MIWFLIFLVLACSEDKLTKIDGTSVRIGTPKSSTDSDVMLKLYTDETSCERLLKERKKDPLFSNCLPWVNRGAGEVRLSFSFMLGADIYRLPADLKHVDVTHNGQLVRPGDLHEAAIELVPHDPLHVPQLFVLLIDASGSMNIKDSYADKNRMEIVKSALKLPQVREAFFPKDVSTRVIVLEFTEGKPRPVGGSLKLISNDEEYTQLISSIQPRGGYTHLYNSIEYASVELLKNEEIKDWMEINEAQPTIIALTDGFNNEQANDVCSDNALRLQRLVRSIRRVRSDSEIDIRYRPIIYTVGLGTPILPRFKLPREDRTMITSSKLCGRSNAEQKIDGNLENKGIDNASLQWIADVGEGSSFVKRSARGLGEAFMSAAAKRYRWYELRYKIHPGNLDRQFKTRFKLNTFAEAEAEVMLYPNSWIDLPPGKPVEGGEWTEKQSILHSFSVLLPILSLLIFIPMLSPMLMNVRRVVSGRRRRPPKPNQQA